MAEGFTKVPMDDSLVLRIKCRNAACGMIFEGHPKQLANAFASRICPFCEQVQFEHESGTLGVFQLLSNALDRIAASKATVEIVIPATATEVAGRSETPLG